MLAMMPHGIEIMSPGIIDNIMAPLAPAFIDDLSQGILQEPERQLFQICTRGCDLSCLAGVRTSQVILPCLRAYLHRGIRTWRIWITAACLQMSCVSEMLVGTHIFSFLANRRLVLRAGHPVCW